MHNNIMATGSRDRPLMLAIGRYAQWQSRFMRYVDIKTKQCSTKKMHPSRLQQGESLNKQDVKTNLCWEFGRFTSRDGQSIESYYSMFYKMMNDMVRNQQTVELDTESYHNLFDILKQYQKEVSEIRADKIAKNANPLALNAAAQQYPDTYYQAPKSHKSHAPPSKQSSYTRSHATTRNKGKEIAKLITPPSESASEEDEDNDLEQAQRDKKINKNVDNSPRNMNDNQTGQFRNQRTLTVAGARETIGNQECKKPKRAKDYTYHKENMLMCKQAEKGVPLGAKQSD
ncbi:hypothetical protein Tco_0930438 [Tanacetum coccineum]